MRYMGLISAVIYFGCGGLALSQPIYHSGISQRPFNYTGDVDASLLSYIQHLPRRAILQITSTGGDPDFGVEIAKELEKKEISVQVPVICMSACAEYILPSAATLDLGGSALIGLHGNDFIYEHLAKENQKNDACIFKRVKFLEDLYARKGLNITFYKETLAHLALISYQPPDKGQCNARISHAVTVWFPTSTQLRDDWRLKFKGATCSDSEACVQHALKALKPGILFMFGQNKRTAN